MKKLLLIGILFWMFSNVFAQRPKLYLKAFGGVHVHNLVYREEVKNSDNFLGWQGGFGFRVSYRKIFGEIDFDFVRSGLTIFVEDTTLTEIGLDKFDVKLNALEIPLKAGIMPIKTPFFKWYLYTGAGFRFNTRVILKLLGEQYKYNPKEVDLRVMNIDWFFGTQMDLGWLNIDIIYGIGLTNSTKTDIRTNSHEIQLNLGYLF